MREDIPLIGADPEMMVVDDEDRLISAIGLVGGSKENPKPVKNGAVQEDNVLAEFNIDPADREDRFLFNIQEVMRQLEEIVSPYKLKAWAFANYPQELLLAGGEKAITLGCDPDSNAWSGEENISPDGYTTFRTASGHIHFGFNKKEVNYLDVVKMSDYYLGIPSVLLFDDYKRREMYGGAGAHREKPYGVEYRVLSNGWLSEEKYIRWAYRNSVEAYQRVEDLNRMMSMFPPERVIETINTGNTEAAIEAVEVFNIPMP